MSITLNQLIDQVREELLTEAKADSPDMMYPFLFVEDIEIEVQVNILSAAEVGGKIKIQVAELGSKLKAEDQITNRIKIKLTPLFSKEETRQLLEQRVGERVMNKIEDTNLKGTTKSID